MCNEPILGKCDSCGETKEVTRRKDPYVAELYGEEEARESRYCDECYAERHNEV